jgi:hypothetical protein
VREINYDYVVMFILLKNSPFPKNVAISNDNIKVPFPYMSLLKEERNES